MRFCGHGGKHPAFERRRAEAGVGAEAEGDEVALFGFKGPNECARQKVEHRAGLVVVVLLVLPLLLLPGGVGRKRLDAGVFLSLLRGIERLAVVFDLAFDGSVGRFGDQIQRVVFGRDIVVAVDPRRVVVAVGLKFGLHRGFDDLVR
jgi:hypothetical protein